MNGCSCIPYSNTCCCGPVQGICVAQPKCQRLLDGLVYSNPVYLQSVHKSFWTYKVLTDCGLDTQGVTSIVIPICQRITKKNIIVYEKINSCTSFEEVKFSIEVSDPFYGDPPPGFSFLKINSEDRYDKGVSVTYLFEIQGDYPTASMDVEIEAETQKLVFDCGCYKMPSCPPEGKLTIEEKCTQTITDNQLSLHYDVLVSNVGDAPLDDVFFEDTIYYDTSLAIESVEVQPALTVDLSKPGQIKVSGELGTLEPSQDVAITYDIHVDAFTKAGSFTISNKEIVSSGSQEQTASCEQNVNVIKLKGDKCCVVEGDQVTFHFSIANRQKSPQTKIDYNDRLVIPENLTVKFLDFDGCKATYEESGQTVLPNMDVAGPVAIILACSGITLGQSTTFVKNILLQIVCTTGINETLKITNTLRQAKLTNPDKALLLPVENIPVTAEVDVSVDIKCQKPCRTDGL